MDSAVWVGEDSADARELAMCDGEKVGLGLAVGGSPQSPFFFLAEAAWIMCAWRCLLLHTPPWRVQEAQAANALAKAAAEGRQQAGRTPPARGCAGCHLYWVRRQAQQGGVEVDGGETSSWSSSPCDWPSAGARPDWRGPPDNLPITAPSRYMV